MPAGAPSPPELVLATTNPGKLLEFRAILGDLSVALLTLEAFPEVRLPEVRLSEVRLFTISRTWCIT